MPFKDISILGLLATLPQKSETFFAIMLDDIIRNISVKSFWNSASYIKNTVITFSISSLKSQIM